MRKRAFQSLAAPVLAGLLLTGASAKNTKPALPAYILHAHTVAVIIDPRAGINAEDPNANQTALRDVETALDNWGRFQPVLATRQADLVIVVRKGSGKLAQQTISDPRQNSRVGVIRPTDDGISVSVQHGTPAGPPPGGIDDGTGSARPQLQVGDGEDSFAVYEGGMDNDNPMDSAPGWRWVRKDGLHSHDVPAVAEFRKAVAEAEKQAAKQSDKTP
jgi:hypothetical protein